jgi:hypothetical protein
MVMVMKAKVIKNLLVIIKEISSALCPDLHRGDKQGMPEQVRQESLYMLDFVRAY